MVLRQKLYGDDADAFVVVLRLDDVFYWFQEDPDDGYRSSLGVVKKFLGHPQDMPPGAFVAFDPVMVALSIGVKPSPDDPSRRSDLEQKDRVLRGVVLRGMDDRTGSVLFEIGTENIDEYYPSFVHRWTPEAMAI